MAQIVYSLLKKDSRAFGHEQLGGNALMKDVNRGTDRGTS
jgi:hypothetical protein